MTQIKSSENTFNAFQREILLNELENINSDIESEKRNRKTSESKEDSKQYKSISEPYHLIKLHLLQERKVMVENLLKANDWVYIDEYNATKESYKS